MWPRLPMPCMAVSIHVRWGCPMGLGWPRMEFANSSCLTMTSLGLRAAHPSHLTLCHLRRPAMLVWPVVASSTVVEGPLTSASGRHCGRSPAVPPVSP